MDEQSDTTRYDSIRNETFNVRFKADGQMTYLPHGTKNRKR